MRPRLLVSSVAVGLVVGLFAVGVSSPGTSHRRALAFVGGVAIAEDAVASVARARGRSRTFGAEEATKPVSLAPEREPGAPELASALELAIDEEALVQEGLRRGYDADPTVRRRLVARLVEELEAAGGAPEDGAGAEVDPQRYREAVARAREGSGAWVAPDALDRLLAAASR